MNLFVALVCTTSIFMLSLLSLTGELRVVDGLDCWNCSKCRGEPNKTERRTGNLVTCKGENVCWFFSYTHGRSRDKIKVANNTNVHRLCDSVKRKPSMGQCQPVRARGLRGFECQCDHDLCNVDPSKLEGGKSGTQPIHHSNFVFFFLFSSSQVLFHY